MSNQAEFQVACSVACEEKTEKTSHQSANFVKQESKEIMVILLIRGSYKTRNGPIGGTLDFKLIFLFHFIHLPVRLLHSALLY